MSTPSQPPTQPPTQPTEPSQPPVAPRRPTSREIHGRTRTDDYEWLREKESPEVLAHLEAENAWTRARTAHLADLRATIFEEIRTRTRETDLSVPTRNRGHWYYGRSFAGKEYGATCRVPVADPDDWTPPRPAEDCAPDQPALPGEEVLLDLDALAEGHDFFSLGGAAVSPDGTLLAYATDVVGDERYTVRVKDLRTCDLLPDVVEGVHRVATLARSQGVSLAMHTHANHANSVTPMVARGAKAMLDAGLRDVRNQGVLLNGRALETRPSYLIGGAAHPFAPPYADRPAQVLRKAALGADFLITQHIFDLPRWRAFLADLDALRAAAPPFALLGGTMVGEGALLRFYVLHCVALPLVIGFLMAVHFWRVRKDGGISGPL